MRDVVIEGVVMGIPFLAYDIDVNLDVPAGATEDLNYEVPLRGVSEQALGLLPATLSIHDGDGRAAGRRRLHRRRRGLGHLAVRPVRVASSPS